MTEQGVEGRFDWFETKKQGAATMRVVLKDLDHPSLAIFRHLKRQNDTRGEERFVVEGEKLVDRLLRSRFPLDAVVLSERCEDVFASRIPASVPYFVLPHREIESLVGFNLHKGVLASGRRLSWPALESMVAHALPGPSSSLLLVPHIDNPENLGALLRIADVFGLLGVVLGPRSPEPLSRRVIRVSMGSALEVPVFECNPLEPTVSMLQRLEYRVVATVTDSGATPLYALSTPSSGRVAIMLGSEGNGLDPSWIPRCDDCVTIPMRPGAESLNLAVAAGILTHAIVNGLTRSKA